MSTDPDVFFTLVKSKNFESFYEFKVYFLKSWQAYVQKNIFCVPHAIYNFVKKL